LKFKEKKDVLLQWKSYLQKFLKKCLLFKFVKCCRCGALLVHPSIPPCECNAKFLRIEYNPLMSSLQLVLKKFNSADLNWFSSDAPSHESQRSRINDCFFGHATWKIVDKFVNKCKLENDRICYDNTLVINTQADGLAYFNTSKSKTEIQLLIGLLLNLNPNIRCVLENILLNTFFFGSKKAKLFVFDIL